MSLQKFINYFDEVSTLPFHDFAHHKRAKAEQVKYRALFTALARRIGLFSFPQLGQLFKKDHTTIIHYEKRHLDMFENDDAYALIYMDLEENIKKLIEEKHGET